MSGMFEFKIALLTLFISAFVSIAVTDYHDYEQAISNKEATAEQLSIEIKSLNQSLQQCADYYNRNLDLSLIHNGENPPATQNFTDTFIVYRNNTSEVPIIMVVNNSEITWKQAEINSAQNGEYSWNLPIFYDTKVNSVVLDTIYIPPPLYNEHGMYYLYAKDISNFDDSTAQDLFLYYSHVTMAESDRAYLQTSLDVYGVDLSGVSRNFTNQQFCTYIDMRVHLIKANAIEQRLLKELEYEINENLVHFMFGFASNST